MASPRQKQSRRSPVGVERVRDAERTRALILSAAKEEFASKGLAGGRVGAIAERAGVNKQLISYYFGGKDGLYQEVLKSFEARSQNVAYDAERPYHEIVEGHYAAHADEPIWAQILLWEQHTNEVEASSTGVNDRADRYGRIVADMARRQANGEIAADLDVMILLLVSIALVDTPAVFPKLVRDICGTDILDPAFQERYRDQLGKIVRHLAQS